MGKENLTRFHNTSHSSVGQSEHFLIAMAEFPEKETKNADHLRTRFEPIHSSMFHWLKKSTRLDSIEKLKCYIANDVDIFTKINRT